MAGRRQPLACDSVMRDRGKPGGRHSIIAPEARDAVSPAVNVRDLAGQAQLPPGPQQVVGMARIRSRAVACGRRRSCVAGASVPRVQCGPVPRRCLPIRTGGPVDHWPRITHHASRSRPAALPPQRQCVSWTCVAVPVVLGIPGRGVNADCVSRALPGWRKPRAGPSRSRGVHPRDGPAPGSHPDVSEGAAAYMFH